MTASTPTRRIIWAVDPFAQDVKLQRATAWALKAFAKNRDAEVCPVYLQERPLAFDFVGVPLNLVPEPVFEKVRFEGQAKLDHITRPVRLSHLKPLEVISEGSSSLQSGVVALLEHAKAENADLIALSTRAKSGPARWILGSFAETLSLRSDVPLLIVNPGWTRRANFKEILFATDLSDESREAFTKVISLACVEGSRIKLYHKIKYDLTPGVEVAFAAYPRYKQVFDEEVRQRKAEASLWADEAKSAGVPIQVEIDFKLGGSVVDAILKRAKGKACLIAMAAHSGPVWRALIGSTSRKVIRAACDPVWIIHSPAKVKGQIFDITEGEVMKDLVSYGKDRRHA